MSSNVSKRNLSPPFKKRRVYRLVSHKSHFSAEVEYSIERSAFYRLEYDPSIVSFVPQPLGFHYLFNGKKRTYTPDFLVVNDDGTETYWEVKPYEETLKEVFVEEFQAKKLAAREMGRDLSLITERQTKIPNLQDNLQLIHYYIRIKAKTTILQEQVYQIVCTHEPITVMAVSEMLSVPVSDISREALILLNKGEIHANLRILPFGEYSKLWKTLEREDYRIIDESEPHSDEGFFVPSDWEIEKNKLVYLSIDQSMLIERDLDSFPKSKKKEALERFKLLSLMDSDNPSGGWSPNKVEMLLDTHMAQVAIKRPSYSTFRRWERKFRESDGDIKSLVNMSHKRGSREWKIFEDEAFFDKAVVYYLQLQRPNIAGAYQYYSDLISMENKDIVSGKIHTVCYRTFYDRIKKLPPYEVAYQRYGRYHADQLFRLYQEIKKPTRVLERVEIDHTTLDMVLLDDDLLIPLGRPNLTVAIDVFSGCVIGFHLGFNSASYLSVRSTLLNAMKNKKYIHDMEVKFENDWVCEGKIETLVVDNGLEFIGSNLKEACNEAKINLEPNPVRMPWLKPSIERFFGTMNQKFLSPLPGKSFSNILEKKDYDSLQKACIRFSTFVEEFHRWIVDVYNVSSDSRFRRIPNLYWQRSIEVRKPINILPSEMGHLEVIMGMTLMLKPSRTGFKYKELKYDSTALKEYCARYAGFMEKKALLKINPDDLSSIYVFLDADEHEKYLKVPAVDHLNYTKNLSLHAHEIILKAHKEYIKGEVNIESLVRARMAIHERMMGEQSDTAQRPKPQKTLQNTKSQAKYLNINDKTLNTLATPPPDMGIDEQPEQEDPFADWDDL